MGIFIQNISKKVESVVVHSYAVFVITKDQNG